MHRTKVLACCAMVTVLQMLLEPGRQSEVSLYSSGRKMYSMNVITLRFLQICTG